MGGRGHGGRQPEMEPVFMTPGSRLTGVGRGSPAPNSARDDAPGGPPPSSTLTAARNQNSRSPTMNGGSLPSGLNSSAPPSLHTLPRTPPILTPSQTLPRIDTSAFNHLLSDPKVLALLPNGSPHRVPESKSQPAADPRELCGRVVTIKNEIIKLVADLPNLEGLIKKTADEISKKAKLLEALIGAKNSKEEQIKKLRDQEEQIFKQLCHGLNVRAPDVPQPLAPRPPPTAVSTPQPTLNQSVVEPSSQTVPRLSSPSSPTGSDNSAPTVAANTTKGLSQRLVDKAEAAKTRKRVADLNKGPIVTSGVKSSTPIRMPKKRRDNDWEIGSSNSNVGGDVAARVSKTTITPVFDEDEQPVVKNEPMDTDTHAGGDLENEPSQEPSSELPPAAAAVHEAASSEPQQVVPSPTTTQNPTSTPTVNREATSSTSDVQVQDVPSGPTETSSEDSSTENHGLTKPLETDSSGANGISCSEPRETQNVKKIPGPASRTTKIFPPKISTNVQDPVAFRVKLEKDNFYPGEDKKPPVILAAVDQMPIVVALQPAPPTPSPPEEPEEDDEAMGILSMLSKYSAGHDH